MSNVSGAMLTPTSFQPSSFRPSPAKAPKLSISLANSTNIKSEVPDIREILAKNRAVLPSISPSRGHSVQFTVHGTQAGEKRTIHSVSQASLSEHFSFEAISVPKRQNPVPLHLVNLRYRALKFLAHFSSVLPTKVLQRQSKVVTHKT